jgi:hypothetical protein
MVHGKVHIIRGCRNIGGNMSTLNEYLLSYEDYNSRSYIKRKRKIVKALLLVKD